ncbi:hypothetical protein UA08_03284 [Talaromyces atroroseus]|uniref:1,3-beta-glucanosyltransferase n=1 Tax=Talaromyces atroroseus TaxID=1441469 RepID=A0A225ARP1_TALAT|nr:hypothetical protein UA08_03284 [Talaromyces atroroseus]OKL61034.1 hypothetical protein UA08_03284 [Talaromyces atroroseus]
MWCTRLWLCLVLALVLGVYGDVDPIVIQPTLMLSSFIKGLAYQSYSGDTATLDISSTDYLAVQTACSRDVPVFQELGINTITLYNVDATQDHDYCMNLLQEAGIYVIPYLRELNTVGISSSWTAEDFSEKTAIVDAFASYNNVLAFLVDVETIQEDSNTTSTPFFKAAVRDVKAYIASQGYRSIPVGIDSDSFPEWGQDTLDYFNCQNSSDSVDIYGASLYTWCGNATMESSGWDEFTDMIKNYSIPVFMAEYGCNGQTTFTEVAALYGTEMTPYWSGGVLYTYAGVDYGLVNVSGQTVDKGETYSAFSSQLASVTLSPTNAASYTPSNTATPSCPSVVSTWEASPTLPPQPDADFCDCSLRQSYCQVQPDLNSTVQDEIVSYICGTDINLCSGLLVNSTIGEYGIYTMCNTTTMLSLLISNNTQAASSTDSDDQDSYTSAAQCAASGSTNSSSGSSSNSQSSGISKGAIAGIVVGVVAGIAIIAGAVVIVVRRQRARNGAQQEKSTDNTGPPELPAGGSYETAELPAAQPVAVELHSDAPPVELPAEMPAGR